MKELKRVAKVGEKIKIVNPFLAHGYRVGDVFTVKSIHPENRTDFSHVKTTDGHTVLTIEYVVLAEPTIVERLEGVLATIEAQAVAVREMIQDARKEAVEAAKPSRTEIVQKAAKTVTELESAGKSVFKDLPSGAKLRGTYFQVQFNVNESKRTVVAIVKNNNGEVKARGVAKCDLSDLFNSQVGKAIALQRAFGLPVDPDFLNVPRH